MGKEMFVSKELLLNWWRADRRGFLDGQGFFKFKTLEIMCDLKFGLRTIFLLIAFYKYISRKKKKNN